jgi:hypothetical protein
MPEQCFRRDLGVALVPQSKGRCAIARLERALGRRVVIGYSVALHIASSASRLLGFVEAAAGVCSLFLMSGLPSARGDQ